MYRCSEHNMYFIKHNFFKKICKEHANVLSGNDKARRIEKEIAHIFNSEYFSFKIWNRPVTRKDKHKLQSYAAYALVLQTMLLQWPKPHALECYQRSLSVPRESDGPRKTSWSRYIGMKLWNVMVERKRTGDDRGMRGGNQHRWFVLDPVSSRSSWHVWIAQIAAKMVLLSTNNVISSSFINLALA